MTEKPAVAALDTQSKGEFTLVLNVGTVQHSVRFEVLTAVTVKNVVFWDITTQFVLHKRHITSPLQSTAG
jgi:hypothetical protein